MNQKDGFLLIKKEKGMTSHDVVFKIRKIMNTKKTGHAGTLDPNAEGLLIAAVGKATRFIEYLEVMDKSYCAEIIFGQRTDTDDITGDIMEQCQSEITAEQLNKVIPDFTGQIKQVPPIYCALKIQGKKAYDLARQGRDVTLSERPVVIHDLMVSDFSELPEKAILEINCSKGTYIRSLCRDIGEALGTPACMGELLRTRIGSFHLNNAVTLSELIDLVEEDAVPFIPIEKALSHFRSVQLTERGEKMVCNGCLCYPWSSQTDFNHFIPGEILRFTGASGFIGVGVFESSLKEDEPDYIRPKKILGRN